jgi:signal peptidase I
MNLMQLLTIALTIAVSLWALETFIATPLRQRKAVASGSVPPEQLQALLAEPALSRLMGNVVIATVVALFLLVVLLRQDVDFSLVLVVATAATGLFWLLYVLFTRRFRTALVHAANQGSGVPETQQPVAPPALVEYSVSFFPVLAVVLIVRSFLFEPFTIPSGSMLPTLEVGDYILVSKYSYGLRLPVLGKEVVAVAKPQRGDVMVFKYPEDPSVNFIKRVIGIPGDHVRVQAGHVFVNGKEMPREKAEFPGAGDWELYYREKTGDVEHLIRHEDGRESASPQNEWVVPDGSYFMMGDNRDNSRDSRFWGFVPDRLIVGKASWIWMHKEPGLHLPTFGRDGKVR